MAPKQLLLSETINLAVLAPIGCRSHLETASTRGVRCAGFTRALIGADIALHALQRIRLAWKDIKAKAKAVA